MKNKQILFALIILIVILLLLVSSFANDIRRLHTNGVFVYPNSIRNLSQRPIALSDINLIAGWMTFNYINKAFSLPPDYLQTALNISNRTYPNITISKIAKEQGLSVNIYLEKVKSAVSSYFTQNTSLQ